MDKITTVIRILKVDMSISQSICFKILTLIAEIYFRHKNCLFYQPLYECQERN
jgi:hypothetical protein